MCVSLVKNKPIGHRDLFEIGTLKWAMITYIMYIFCSVQFRTIINFHLKMLSLGFIIGHVLGLNIDH